MSRGSRVWLYVSVGSCLWVLAGAAFFHFESALPNSRPSARILLPQNGDRVNGTIVVVMNIAPKSKVDYVGLSINGGAFSRVDGPPYKYRVGTASLANGPLSLSGIVRDTAGNQLSIPAVTVVVDNAVSHPSRFALASFESPTKMTLGQYVRIKARVTRETGSLEGNPPLINIPQPFIKVVSARLFADGLEIQPLSDEEQIVPDTDFAEWRWNAHAQFEGTGHLYLTLANVSNVLGRDRKLDIHFEEREISIEKTRAPVVYSFLATHEGLVWTGIGGLIGIFLAPIATELAKKLFKPKTASSG
ncbi:MAG: Ig-like domain-containing protein [Candidatus Sulfotelmatobacter sp.]